MLSLSTNLLCTSFLVPLLSAPATLASPLAALARLSSCAFSATQG